MTIKYASIKHKIFITLIVAVAYFLALYPSQYWLNVLPGTEIRVASFIPVVGGILFGWPAAIGVFIGNLCSDLMIYGATAHALLIAGSLCNGLAAVLAHFLFNTFNRNGHGDDEFIYNFVHDFRSLVSYIATVVLTQLMLSLVIGCILNKYGGIPLLTNIKTVLFSNIEICMLIGLPAIIYIPCFLPKNRNLIGTIRFRMFSALMMSSEILSVGIGVLLYFLNASVADFNSLNRLQIIAYLFKMNGILIVTLTLSFGYLARLFEIKISKPLEQISRIVRNDGDDSRTEIDVLMQHIDFAADGSSNVSGNEYSLYVGLNSKDLNKTFSPQYAREVIGNICLNYVGGYFSHESAIGGYRGEEGNSNEQVLIYQIFGASDEQIESICKDVKQELQQESILIEKNKLTRWYY